MKHQDTQDSKGGGDSACSALDDYLDGELSVDEAEGFERHLDACATCAEAADAHQWIAGLLQSPQAAELEAAPRAALAAMRLAVRRRRRRALAVAALAAGIAAAVVWPWFSSPRQDGPGEGLNSFAADSGHHFDAAVERPSPRPSLRGRRSAAATFVSTGDAIVVPVESNSDEVTVVQLYSTYDSQRRVQLNAALSSLSSESNGG